MRSPYKTFDVKRVELRPIAGSEVGKVCQEAWAVGLELGAEEVVFTFNDRRIVILLDDHGGSDA